jgi:hypothetical protein
LDWKTGKSQGILFFHFGRHPAPTWNMDCMVNFLGDFLLFYRVREISEITIREWGVKEREEERWDYDNNVGGREREEHGGNAMGEKAYEISVGWRERERGR